MRRFFRNKKPTSLIESYDPESYAMMEVQRLFKAFYGKGESGSGLSTLMVTSAMPQEGKSTLIGHLALVAAHANQRTLILDADIRHPFQHRLFHSASSESGDPSSDHLPSSPGLSDYLQKDAELDQIIHNTALENLKLIPCGKQVSSPGGLLQANLSNFKVLLDQCHLHFDVVLVDVSPVLPVTDAELIGSLVDGVVLIVKAGKTYREIVQRALELLQKSGCNLLGITLNNITGILPYHYENKYYHDKSR